MLTVQFPQVLLITATVKTQERDPKGIGGYCGLSVAALELFTVTLQENGNDPFCTVAFTDQLQFTFVAVRSGREETVGQGVGRYSEYKCKQLILKKKNNKRNKTKEKKRKKGCECVYVCMSECV